MAKETTSNNLQKIRNWNKKYYNERSKNHNNLLQNPEILFQAFAVDASVYRGIKTTNLALEKSMVLDMGCGLGGGMIHLLRLGFEPSNLFGIDILESRILKCKKKFPNINFTCGDASDTDYSDDSFDITLENMVLIQVVDDDVAEKIAKEMLRVVKPNGYIILIDWRYSKPFRSDYKGLSKKRISNLFHVGLMTECIACHKGALIPPAGRFLSKYFPFIYFLIQFLFPFMVGQVTTVLQKKSPQP